MAGGWTARNYPCARADNYCCKSLGLFLNEACIFLHARKKLIKPTHKTAAGAFDLACAFGKSIFATDHIKFKETGRIFRVRPDGGDRS